MRVLFKTALAAMLCLLPGAVLADPPKPLFASDEILHLTLKAPVTHISRKAKAADVPGTLIVDGATPETLPVTLSVRGITRRLEEVCTFPPLRVDFTGKPGKTSVFKGQKHLKLVTHCQAPENFQQHILLEYAAYRLYRALTPDSFNVRLAQVDYVNNDGSPITSRLGFFIEDIDDVAKRNGQERLRGVNRIAVTQLDPSAAARFALFQDLISNLDWAMTASAPGEDCCHNARLVGAQNATTALIPVPYDFDFSGLVDAPYAVPPDNIRVDSVRTRRYRGFCVHNDQVRAAAAVLTAQRPQLLALVDQTPQLDAGSRQKAASYLGKFFDQIATPAQMNDILGGCLH